MVYVMMFSYVQQLCCTCACFTSLHSQMLSSYAVRMSGIPQGIIKIYLRDRSVLTCSSPPHHPHHHPAKVRPGAPHYTLLRLVQPRRGRPMPLVGGEVSALLLSLCRLIALLLRGIWKLTIQTILSHLLTVLGFHPKTPAAAVVPLPGPAATLASPVAFVLCADARVLIRTRTGLLHLDNVRAPPHTVTRRFGRFCRFCRFFFSFYPSSAGPPVLAVPVAALAEPVACSWLVWRAVTCGSPGGATSRACSLTCSRYDTGCLTADVGRIYRCVSSSSLPVRT
jgi:hypothetical protein